MALHPCPLRVRYAPTPKQVDASSPTTFAPPARDRPGLAPPLRLVPSPMEFTMVDTAQWDRKFVTHLASQRSGLSEANMMSVTRCAATQEVCNRTQAAPALRLRPRTARPRPCRTQSRNRLRRTSVRLSRRSARCRSRRSPEHGRTPCLGGMGRNVAVATQVEAAEGLPPKNANVPRIPPVVP